MRLVDHRDYIEESDLLAAVNARTRVMAVSQMSFYGGQNLRIERLADGLAEEHCLPLMLRTRRVQWKCGRICVTYACLRLTNGC